MQINSDNLIKDAQRLRRTQEEIKSKRSEGSLDDSRPAREVQVTLDELNVNLRVHQQNVVKLQLESVGLEQVERNLEFLVKSNPGDFEDIKKAINEIDTALTATRFRDQELIPSSLREVLRRDREDASRLPELREDVARRRDEVDGQLATEYGQISRIQVSFENILSGTVPAGPAGRALIDELKEKLAFQQQIQGAMNPETVRQLLET